MTILLFTEDPRQGQALSALLASMDGRHLYLVFSPDEAAEALGEVRADRVVCSAGAEAQVRAAASAKWPPRLFLWPERVTEAWLQALCRE